MTRPAPTSVRLGEKREAAIEEARKRVGNISVHAYVLRAVDAMLARDRRPEQLVSVDPGQNASVERPQGEVVRMPGRGGGKTAAARKLERNTVAPRFKK